MIESAGKKIASSLQLHGVDTIFCVPGESYLGLTDALTDVPGIRLISLPADARHVGERIPRKNRVGAVPGFPADVWKSPPEGESMQVVSTRSPMAVSAGL